MRQILLIPIICFLAVLLEFTLFNVFGAWGDADLLLLVVVFFNLYSGIRFSLWAALVAGVLKDCFSTMPFGTNVFAYVACAYMSLFIRRYAYERGSDLSKLWMIFCVITARTLAMGLVHKMTFEDLRWWEVWRNVWLPELVVTLALALPVFRGLQFMAKFIKI